MSYQAISTELINVRKHPNADRLQLASAGGYQVIVSTDAREGDRGILIPSGAALSREFCLAHDLYRKHPETGEPMGGYLDATGRVVSMALRGERSEALFLTLDGVELPALGESFSELPDFPAFVKRYETPAETRARAANGNGAKLKQHVPGFEKHYDTGQLRHNAESLAALVNDGGKLIITEKVHGTSGRTARLHVEQPLSKLAQFWNRIAPRWLAVKPRSVEQVVTGTRNTVVGEGHGDAYRIAVSNYFAPLLKIGEMVYYEIAGYTDRGGPIMSPHDIAKGTAGMPKAQAKAIGKAFGETAVYHYGCHPSGVILGHPESWDGYDAPRFRVFIYRITQDGDELTWDALERRAGELSFPGHVELVPVLQTFEGETTADEITRMANAQNRDLSDLGSTLDGDHPGEGVCLRVDHPERGAGRAVKHKAFLFCVMEGIAANDPDFVDTEVVS